MDERRKTVSLNGLPGWAQVVSVLGFPIVVAMLLLGMFMGYLKSPITNTETMVTQHVKGEDQRIYILRVMCRQSAKRLGADPDECDVRPGRQ